MVTRYGDFVLYRPPMKPSTWLLWIGPFLLVVIGVVALFMYLRRRNAESGPVALTEEEHKRAQALLQSASQGDKT